MKNKLAISSFTLIVAFVALSLIGLALLPMLPVKLNPSRSLPSLTVSFSMPGNSSRVIETEVTSKLEGMLARVGGIEKVESVSDNGSGRITMQLDKHADIDMLRFEVSTIIRQTWPELPAGVSYPIISTQQTDDEASRPFLTYTINAPVDPYMIQQWAEMNMKPVLGQLAGIYRVDLSGATPQEWRLTYDNRQLAQHGISVADVQAAIANHLGREFMGIVALEHSSGDREWIRVAKTGSYDDLNLKTIFVRTAQGELISLDKLLSVTHVQQESTSYYRINGLNSVYLNLTAEESANQLRLASEVKAAMQRLEALLPAGYEVHTGYDATEYIQDELSKIYFRTGLTVLILLAFVALITLNRKYLFLIVCSLTVNICIALIFYYLFGLEIQIYSLAGITISLNLVIDNTIVMSDHLMRKRNLQAFLSILAATLTTIGALVIIFFMDEKVRLNLQDFAAVVIINLAVSLLVALFFVPSLMEKIGLENRQKHRLHSWRHRWAVHITSAYQWLIGQLVRYRVAACLLLVLAFGLPVYMLPEKAEGEGFWAQMYNKVFGSETYQQSVKPYVDTALGGTLRLFADKVRSSSYYSRGVGEVVLSVYATLPNGSTLEQMNVLIGQMEAYLSEFQEIRQFQTYIYNPYQARINIYFKKAYERGGFPYTLKSDIISKALTLGGGSWSVTGLQDQGFSNDVRETAGSMRVTMYGYNYDELYAQAERLKSKLLERRRIRDVLINSEYTFWKNDYSEYYLKLDKEAMAQEGISALQLFTAIRPLYTRNQHMGSIVVDNQSENLKLTSQQSEEYDVWALVNVPFQIGDRYYKLADFATLEKGQSPQEVAKEDQQYRLCVQYEYVGSSEQGRKLLKQDVEALRPTLPMGYSIELDDSYYTFSSQSNGQYALLLLVIVIIIFITSILFNSLTQPLAIVFVIPISYIGVFLTFYLFNLNFDQGGFASFVLLCGITVNASIYIMNEYNKVRRRFPRLSPVRAYTKAWNTKIIPIFLTVVSTILGFIPFLIGTSREAFWFPLAAGTIGGLLMSLVGIFFYLPIFSLKKERKG